VVDDHSRDGTPAIAQAASAPPLTSARLSAGWTGKTWALDQASSGDRRWKACLPAAGALVGRA
jgi:hypothetical protein